MRVCRTIPVACALILWGIGCSTPPQQNHNSLIVCVLPIKQIVSEITGGHIPIDVLVPPGASPESYEPTPAKLVQITESQLFFTTGLMDFERELVARLSDDARIRERIVDLSRGVDLIETPHSHARENHSHGADPHIWTSPAALKTMARTAWERLALLYPDSTHYELNVSNLIQKIDSLDREIRKKTEVSARKIFLIYHPALAYWARDYGYEQIALEDEGKEPSAEHLAQVVARARHEQIRKILYQSQFSRRTVEALAREIGAEAVEIDPLAENTLDNLMHLTDLITE